MSFVLYYKATGEYITARKDTVTPDTAFGAPAKPADIAVTGAVGSYTSSTEVNTFTQYHDVGVTNLPISRPLITAVASWNKTSITASGADVATFGPSLPNPTTVRVYVSSDSLIANPSTKVSTTVTGGTFSFDADAPGTYTVEVISFPYQAYTQNIIAT